MKKCHLTTKLKKADGLSRLDMLEQSKWWADQHGRVVRTQSLDRMHRIMLIRWLLDNAFRLRMLVEFDRLFVLHDPYDEAWMDAVEPLPDMRDSAYEWMADRPLFKTLLTQAAGEATNKNPMEFLGGAGDTRIAAAIRR